MIKGIYISIKSKFVQLILNGDKNYEFRKYIPKEKIDRLYVYETYPKSELRCIIEISNIYKYPRKLSKIGYGNEEFNKGLKKAKYAYEFKRIIMLKNPIQLDKLKSTYNFNPPQKYVYSDKYEKLTRFIEKEENRGEIIEY